MVAAVTDVSLMSVVAASLTEVDSYETTAVYSSIFITMELLSYTILIRLQLQKLMLAYTTVIKLLSPVCLR